MFEGFEGFEWLKKQKWVVLYVIIFKYTKLSL